MARHWVPQRALVGYDVGMQRQLLLLAVLVGCGSVNNGTPDGGSQPSDGQTSTDGPAPSDGPTPNPTDVLGGTLRNGCVVALHMEEPSWSGATGEVKDDCGNDNPGTVITDTVIGAGTTTVAGGVHGRAGSFTGGACVDIPNAAALHGTTGLTLSAWIFPTALDAGDTHANGVISKRNDNSNGSEYNLSVWLNNDVWVDLDTENDRFRGSREIKVNEWAQLTMVYDGTRAEPDRVHVYVNNVLDAVQGETSTSLTPFTSTLHIGCMPAPSATPPTQQHFEGRIDEVVIWNRALADAELAQWYVNTKPP
jgi:hypothetical protein